MRKGRKSEYKAARRALQIFVSGVDHVVVKINMAQVYKLAELRVIREQVV